MGTASNKKGHVSHDSAGDTKPTTKSDMQLRIKHTKDSIKYNQEHAKDHDRALTKAKKQLAETQRNLKKAPKF